jgi:hypothetical protein
MALTYDLVINCECAWAHTTISADNPQHALQKIQRRIAKDEDQTDIDYEHYDAIGLLESISIERAGKTLLEYIPPEALVRGHAQSLLAAAEDVICNWDKGNLAAAVSNLASAIAAAKGGAA